MCAAAFGLVVASLFPHVQRPEGYPGDYGAIVCAARDEGKVVVNSTTDTTQREKYARNITTYDIERSAVSFLFATQHTRTLGMASKVALAVVMAFFEVFANALQGVRRPTAR